jgi:hypothetical protein
MKFSFSTLVFSAVLTTSILFARCANTQTNPVSPDTRTETQEINDTLTMPLDFLVNIFSTGIDDPYIGEEIKAFLAVYLDIKNEMLEVSTAQGMEIDFIGIVHHSFGPDQSEVLESQDSLAKLIRLKEWDVIGYEGSSKFGYLTKRDLVDETKLQLAAIKMDTSSAGIAHALNTNRAGDFLQQEIERGRKNVIGTERAEAWHLQQKLIFLVEGVGNNSYRGLLANTTTALNQVRSTVALVRTAKFMKEHKLKRGVIVYGVNHLNDFSWLQQRFDTKSNFFYFL